MTDSKQMAHVSPTTEKMHKQMGEIEQIDLDNFRSTASEFNFTVWPAASNGLKYQKTMLYNSLATADAGDIALYKRILNRDLGKPMTVCFGDVDVCLDYYQAVQEAKTISAHVNLEYARMMEIGAGFGRTCHTLLSLFNNIDTYDIVDLKPSLSLSKRYLKRTLPDDLFRKITFLDIDEFAALAPTNYDIVINVDSFADMDEMSVAAYLNSINNSADYFYCKNPLGKYLENSTNQPDSHTKAIQQALQSGPLRDIIDIYDSENLTAQVPNFLSCYAPGPLWKPVFHGRALPWTYYHEVLYRNEKTPE